MKKRLNYFKIDKQKYYFLQLHTTNPSFLRKLRLWIFSFGLQAVAVYRFGQLALRIHSKNKLIGKMLILLHYPLHYFITLFYHIDILPVTKIGPGFFIAHGWNIAIGAMEIGYNVSITHNVTIGRGFSEGKEGNPVIGNNVWIGTGSIITGNILIGDDATISAGCVLSKSVPPKSIAAGNPGRTILLDQDNKKYLKYQIPDELMERF